MEFLAAFLIIFGAFTIFGITGFGSAILAVPLLTLIYPFETVTLTMLVLDFFASLLMGIRNKFEADKNELLKILPFTIIGMYFAIWLLSRIESRYLIIVLGCFVLWNGIGVLISAKGQIGIRANEFWRAIFGFFAGVFAALFTTGGVFVASYLVKKIDDAERLRATMALAIFMLTSSVLLVMYFSGISFAKNSLELAMFLTLPMILGGILGLYIFRGLNKKVVKKLYGFLLTISGISLLFKQFINVYLGS